MAKGVLISRLCPQHWALQHLPTKSTKVWSSFVCLVLCRILTADHRAPPCGRNGKVAVESVRANRARALCGHVVPWRVRAGGRLPEGSLLRTPLHWAGPEILVFIFYSKYLIKLDIQSVTKLPLLILGSPSIVQIQQLLSLDQHRTNA